MIKPIALAIACALLTQACSTGTHAPPTSAGTAILQLSTAEFAAKAALGGELDGTSREIRLVDSVSLTPEIVLQRYQASSPHSQILTVAVRGDGQFIPLGGFSSPKPDVLASWIVEAAPSIDARGIGIAIAKALSETGSNRFVLPGAPEIGSDREVASEWSSSRPDDWPADTVFTRSDGLRVVRISLTSQLARSYDRPWLTYAYSFVLDGHGQLIGWAVRAGPAFHIENATPRVPDASN